MPHSRLIQLSACSGAFMIIIGAAWFYVMQTRAHPGGAGLWGLVGADSNVNRPLPDCHLVDLEQHEISADELRKGQVLIVYLTTDCDHCIKEAGTIFRLRHDAPPDLRIYGVTIER